jgi:hypothetical protein
MPPPPTPLLFSNLHNTVPDIVPGVSPLIMPSLIMPSLPPTLPVQSSSHSPVMLQRSSSHPPTWAAGASQEQGRAGGGQGSQPLPPAAMWSHNRSHMAGEHANWCQQQKSEISKLCSLIFTQPVSVTRDFYASDTDVLIPRPPSCSLHFFQNDLRP